MTIKPNFQNAFKKMVKLLNEKNVFQQKREFVSTKSIINCFYSILSIIYTNINFNELLQ